MGKIGGLALVAVMALTGCASAQAGTATTNRATVQPATVQTVRVGIYKAMPDSDFADVERRLCASFEAGYTVEDAARVQLDLFGADAAAQMRAVATSVKATAC
jgi:hypothetical protein